MNKETAAAIVENLLERLEPVGTRFQLPEGILSTKERDALALLAGLANLSSAQEEPVKPIAAALPAASAKFSLNDGCIGAKPCDQALLCIDFGTAFSKASVWKAGDKEPIPLDLGAGFGGGGLLLDSAAFIEEGHIFFGPTAVGRHAALADVERLLFDSPKELLTHDHETFHTSRPRPGIDPSGKFKSRDLLTLYLAFLTSVSGERAATHDVSPHVLRRFAAPGWSNSQVSESSPHFENVATQMNELLIDAQILADSIPADVWTSGLDIAMARSALDELSAIATERKRQARFVQRPVLEAVAAATGVQDQLVNRRPQVLVIDVGAGTTDIGAFKYSIAGDEARVSTYKNGLSALEMAGNRIDDALIDLAWSELNLASDSQLKESHARRMRTRVRDIKRQVFENGSAKIDLDGFSTVTVDQQQLEQTRPMQFFADSFDKAIKKALNGAGIGSKNFLQTSEPNIVVFTGGGSTLPILREQFNKPIDLDGGKAYFEVIDPVPGWVENYGPDVQQIFPQLAVSTGGCAPNLPDEKGSVLDTSVASERSIAPMYR